MDNIDINELQNSSELAVRQQQKFYKAKIEDEHTQEISYVARPIFIIEKKKGEGLYVSPPFLAEFFRLSENVVYLRNFALETEIRYLYRNGVYKQVSDNDLDKILLEYIAAYKFGMQNINAVYQAREFINKKSEKIGHDEMNTDERYINFRNGLLNIRTMKLEPHTPSVFSTIQIPCDWTNEPQKTPVFDKFLNTFTEGNTDKQRLLLEYMGVVISNIKGGRFKKCLFLLGNGDSGKSLISALICEIIGKENTSERSLKKLGERFGLTAVYMTRLVYTSDLEFENVSSLSLFKGLTGGDTLSVEFKHLLHFDYQFRGLMLYGMNALPKFGGDKGSHVYERMIIIRCDNVIPKNQQDQFLLEKLCAEQIGIIQKCINAMQGVIENSYQFHIPDECKINIEKYKIENSACNEFWEECIEPCVEGETCVNTSRQVYNSFRNWCYENGLHSTPSSNEFATEISQYLGLKWKWDIVYRKTKGIYLKNYKLNDIGKNFLE